MKKRAQLSEALRAKILEKSHHRCGYCQAPGILIFSRFDIEHIFPVSLGGTDAEDNLWASCSLCNGYKSNKVTALDPETNQEIALFNPQTQVWIEHFTWAEDKATILGLTPIGRATIAALRINDPDILATRKIWASFGLYPPSDLT